MFDTLKVAKKIREARIEKNLTQMNLADAMSVSYQAVSNWERGNSMPDISKLEDLCRVLQISVTELLGMENKETSTVEKIMQAEPAVSVEELSQIAPIVPPMQVKEQVEKKGKFEKKWNVEALIPLAPYLDEDLLEEITEEMEVESLQMLQSLAPYLDSAVLDRLVRRAPLEDLNGVAALAPFLEEDTLDYLVRRWGGELGREEMEILAPFLEEDTLDYLVRRWGGELGREEMEILAPFLEEDTLDYLVRRWGGELSREEMEILAPFLEEDTIDWLADIRIQKGDADSLAELFAFMNRDTVRKVVRAIMEQGDIDAVKAAAPFL